MAPHSSDTTNGEVQSVSHRRAKSFRVAPAIPYALVKPKPKQSSGMPVKAKQSEPSPVPKAILKTDSAQRSISSAADVPLTPTSASSVHDKIAVGTVTPAESLSDRNQDSDASKPSAVSATTSPPSTHATLSPKPENNRTSNHLTRPSVSMPSHPQGHSNGAVAPQFVQGQSGSAGHVNSNDGLYSGHRHHMSQHTSNGHDHALSQNENMPPYIFNPVNTMPPNSASMMPPPSINPQAYPAGFTSPLSVSSPTSGWNPNANFIPPSHHIATAQRSSNEGVSPVAGSHTSSTPDAGRMSGSTGPFTHMVQSLPHTDAFNWSRYIGNFYSDSSFADLSLSVAGHDSPRTFPDFPVHGIILARSPVLYGIIQSLPSGAKRNSSGLRYITLDINEKLTSYRGVLEAIGYLYGIPLPNFSDGVLPDAPTGILMDRMVSALALAGAGQRLAVPELMSHGLAFAANFITWETFEKALAFSLTSMATVHHYGHGQDLAERCFHYTSNLMFCLERFLINNFPEHFSFVISAPELNTAPRLPAVIEGHGSVSNPRLASIQFGTLTSHDPSTFNSDLMLSSILLSVPTAIISRLLDSSDLATRLGSERLIGIIREVVEEREHRRTKVVSCKRIMPNASSMQRDEVKWSEMLVEHPQAPLGFMLTKESVDQ